MIVWRIEHVRTGEGPYNHREWLHSTKQGHSAREIAYNACVPSPWDSPILKRWCNLPDMVRREYVWSFRSRQHLRMYFTPDMTKALRLLGFHVTLWDTQEGQVYTDGLQVAFRKADAVRLDTSKKVAKRRRNRRQRMARDENGEPVQLTMF